MTDEKLQKVLAAHGFGSRRGMEEWIKAGRIKVNGRVASIGDRVSEEDKIAVDGKYISQKAIRHKYLIYNKPTGEICSRDDPEGRPSVFNKLPRLKGQRWISVGRLDFNTSGLLIFTTDGALANKLMHPSAQIEREYAVRVLGNVDDEQLQNMRDGVLLEDGKASFSDIKKGKSDDSANRWYYVVLMEGRNREVRRLWESQGLTVSRLKRVRFGSLFIPSAIKSGQFRELQRKEYKQLYVMAGIKRP
jgi:23S rRNA pseudouridine2605 synthase